MRKIGRAPISSSMEPPPDMLRRVTRVGAAPTRRATFSRAVRAAIFTDERAGMTEVPAVEGAFNKSVLSAVLLVMTACHETGSHCSRLLIRVLVLRNFN